MSLQQNEIYYEAMWEAHIEQCDCRCHIKQKETAAIVICGFCNE